MKKRLLYEPQAYSTAICKRREFANVKPGGLGTHMFPGSNTGPGERFPKYDRS